MKRAYTYIIPALILAVVSAVGCVSVKDAGTTVPINLIMETDIGNDVDDALAMDLLYKYSDEGLIDLKAVCINKEGSAPAEFTDILNTWYGYPDIPIGIVRNGADCETDAINYAKAVVDLNDATGAQLFVRSRNGYDDLPEAPVLYRKLLAASADSSVTIASVGFSTNLARLLDTPGDGYSELSGKDLVARKVKLLVTMAGNFEDANNHEYNIVKDIPAAKKVFEEWPTPIVTSPFELGIKVQYPATSIENDFGWAGPHPVVEAYKAYKKMPYDRPTWDPTAVLYAVEGESWFNVSEPGFISVTDEGSTLFTPDENGTRRYLYVDDAQADAIRDHFVKVISSVPAKRQ